ncbi:MAG TPA: gliding motility protein GldN [Flavobacterium sp.]|jgi:gliding motility associated protien GldN|nr:gliding motility protein GldN [Flavobacterium sp.]
MKYRIFLIVTLIAFGSFSSFAQSNLLNSKSPDQIGKKTVDQLKEDDDKPLPYGYIEDRDVFYGKTVWEIIDLDERVNLALYYPIDTANIGSDRRSLYDVLTRAIKDGKLTEVYTDGYFNTKKTYKDVLSSLTKIDTSDIGREQYNAGLPIDPQYIIKTDLASVDVTDYKIKGYWYFDKRQSEMKYRLLGLCPVVPDVYTIGKDEQDYVELFWIFFPAAREVLHDAYSFNNKNSAVPVSFDHLLNSRRFSAIIYKNENVYGDREINGYIQDNSQLQLLESERLKEEIRNFESDMWTY